MSDSQIVTLNTITPLIATELNLTNTVVKNVLNSFLTSITTSAINGDTVRISGLGTFTVVDTAERTGRNLATGEALAIPASKRVSFKTSKPFKDAVKASVAV